jgi:hypothetical protein
VNSVLQESLHNVLSKQIFTNAPGTYTHSLVQIAKCFSSNSYFTNTPFFGTDCKLFFFQTAISPIHHSLVQIVKYFFPNSYFTNTPFLGTDCPAQHL